MIADAAAQKAGVRPGVSMIATKVAGETEIETEIGVAIETETEVGTGTAVETETEAGIETEDRESREELLGIDDKAGFIHQACTHRTTVHPDARVAAKASAVQG
eukprot:COSAG02_NODE_8914_length_2402_cov_2.934433_3_plen_104_part_00